MNFFDSFTHEHIHDVLKRTFSYSHESDVLFFADKCNANENFTVLNVKGAGVERKYILAKIPKILKTQENQQLKNSKVVYPVFTLENNNKECYGAFENQHGMEQFVSPERNNTECLKIILQNLAEHHAVDLANNKKTEKPSEYNLKDITDAVTTLDYFLDLNREIIKETIENLQLAFNKLLDVSNLLVRSIGCPFATNVFINHDVNKSIFLNVPLTRVVPPVYDALLYIFALSDEKFRQEHFENLIAYYFNSLSKFLQELQSDFAATVNRTYSEPQVKVLLPVIKFQIANSLIKLENTEKHEKLLTNIFYFLKYPIINQEDIYEITKNKIGSSHYDLLGYSLVGLNEKNGHLGEYFHLDIKIKAQGKEQELQLFGKFLKITTDFQKEVLENGLGKKEDFFYKTLLPLYTKHGLDSLLDFSPKCYLSRINWLVVLDDLSRQGFVGLKPNVALNYEGLRASIEQLAKFHSCTIILEEILSKESGKMVRLDQDYGEFFEESLLLYEEDNPLKGMYDSTIEVLYYIVEKFPEVAKKLSACPKEVRTRLKNAFMSIFSKVKNSDSIRRVINHGDMYVANMLFKFGEDKLVTKGILIDFQLLRYVTPNYDLLFFLFENSTKETRDKYLKALIEDYYQFTSENIRKFNFDPEVVFPKQSFDNNVNFIMSAGLMSAFMYAHVCHIDAQVREDIFHDQEKVDYYMYHHKNELVDLQWDNEHYRNILKGLVEDIIDIVKNEF